METEEGQYKNRKQNSEDRKKETDWELGNRLLEDLGTSLCYVSVQVPLADGLVLEYKI